MKIRKIAQTPGLVATVVDNLVSTSSIDALSANQGKVLNDKINILSTYSTNEVKTGEIWIDGKPIYKKTIQFNTTTTGKHSLRHNISNLDTVVDVRGTTKDSGGAFYIFPMSAATDNVASWSTSIQNIDKTYFYFFRGGQVTGTNISYVTIFYTKTTD